MFWLAQFGRPRFGWLRQQPGGASPLQSAVGGWEMGSAHLRFGAEGAVQPLAATAMGEAHCREGAGGPFTNGRAATQPSGDVRHGRGPLRGLGRAHTKVGLAASEGRPWGRGALSGA